MAKKNQSSKSTSKSPPPVKKEVTSIRIRPEMDDINSYTEFLKSLTSMEDIIKGFLVLLTGMGMVATLYKYAKGLSSKAVFQLPSVNYYIKKLITNNPLVRLAIGSIVAYSTLNYFKNAKEIEDFIENYRHTAPRGKLIPNIKSFPTRIEEHRGGMSKSILGRLANIPVFSPRSIGPDVAGFNSLEDVISSGSFGILEISPKELAALVTMYLRGSDENLEFSDAITLTTGLETTKLEEELMSLSDLKINRKTPETLPPDPALDPNEEGISPLEKHLRIAQIKAKKKEGKK
jgi:hypothetical protein